MVAAVLSMRNAVPVLVALLASLATLPGLASAATYCVHQPGGACGPGEIDKAANLQGALTDALATGGPDDVLVGAGTYTGPFSYSGLAAVNIRGVGDATVLRAANANGTRALGLLSAASTVSSLRIDAPIGNSSIPNFGLETSGTATGVDVVIPSNPTFNTVGVLLRGGAFKGGSVTGPTQLFGVSAVGADTSAPALIEDARLEAYEAVSATGAATIRRVDAVARTGFSLQSENPAGGSFLVEDSVWRTPPGETEGVGIQAGCGSNVDLELTARHLTLVNGATGPDFNYTVAAVCNLAARSAAVDIRNSIILGGVWSLRALANAGPATIDVAYSDYDPTKTEVSGATGAITTGLGNVNVAPGFVGPSDFHLLRDSPLIDAGDPAAVSAGESATDLDGAPRIAPLGLVRRDIGAYELQPLPPGPPPGSGPPDTLAPGLGRLRVEPRRFRVARPAKRKPRASASRTAKIRFRLSESATVRLRIQRPLPGRRAKGRCRKPTRKLRHARRCTRYRTVGTITRRKLPQGANAVAFSGRFGRRALRPGSYRVLADATDPAGNRSRSFTARFTILKPPRR
jgi:hypothetical protein